MLKITRFKDVCFTFTRFKSLLFLLRSNQNQKNRLKQREYNIAAEAMSNNCCLRKPLITKKRYNVPKVVGTWISSSDMNLAFRSTTNKPWMQNSSWNGKQMNVISLANSWIYKQNNRLILTRKKRQKRFSYLMIACLVHRFHCSLLILIKHI